MNSKEIRDKFLAFFKSKQHTIVPSAPMVIKDDPTLMFTNAGMNQFKDIFLGNSPIKSSRITDSQKCLRVSGKHNDLEEVGHDTYHHTMFEMLGNWSFGDYFKNEAIDWAWELLTDVFNISKDRLYATVFEGSSTDSLDRDNEAAVFWEKYLPKDRIINGSKKDNFWEMGDIGPCGPCSEIHIDIRSDEERQKVDAVELINKDHPHVIEIWNLVFIQYNRRKSGELVALPAKHIDTGMGFERLCMVVQGKKSNYDTDVFQNIIGKIAEISGNKYGQNNEKDIAMRVIADHLRTISFAVADGQLPYRDGAGYVIRRILRRAVRYAYTFLDISKPYMAKLVPVLIETMGDAYPELKTQQTLIEKVITEEETSFLRTLETGIKRLNQIIGRLKEQNYKVVKGEEAFVLYDSYGFPFDLTELILKENGLVVSKREFDERMQQQKTLSKSTKVLEVDDWIIVEDDEIEEFIGYDRTETELKVTRYRKVVAKGKEQYHLVFNYTPFYAESGGQVGDTGYIQLGNEKVEVVDTQKEHNVIIHITDELPISVNNKYKAVVNTVNRISTARNHSATHLMHHALREVLGDHVEQKGSLVDPYHLRFDFSHFQKLTDEEILRIETIVNNKIRRNIQLDEKRAITMNEAVEMGAVALFGEKYGDIVRVIKFEDSIELCGGIHVNATGEIGAFKMQKESAIAAGIRRIEAVTGSGYEEYVNGRIDTLHQVESLFKNPKNLVSTIEKLIADNNELGKQIEKFKKEGLKDVKQNLKNNIEIINNINVIATEIEADNAGVIKDLAYQLKGEVDNLFLVLGAKLGDKANLTIMISENLVKEKGLHAGNIIREISKEIQGGGGGQPFFATAGGKNANGIRSAIDKAIEKIKE